MCGHSGAVLAGGYDVDWQIGHVTLLAAGEATCPNGATKIHAGNDADLTGAPRPMKMGTTVAERHSALP